MDTDNPTKPEAIRLAFAVTALLRAYLHERVEARYALDTEALDALMNGVTRTLKDELEGDPQFPFDVYIQTVAQILLHKKDKSH